MAASVSYSPSLSLVLQRNTNSSFSATFSLFDDEAQTVLSLRRDLNTTNPYHGRFSFRFFKIGPTVGGGFPGQQSAALDAAVLDEVKKLWRNDLPSKVLVFGWRLLLDRLPTRGALHHRGILTNPNELNCIFCQQHVEDCEHLFFNCPVITSVWELVYHWIGMRVVTGAAVVNGRHHFARFGNLFRYPKGERVNHLIWLVTTWCVWNLRNQVVFKGAIPNVSSLVDDIQTFSWLWFNGRFARNSCITFSDWCQDHMSSIISL